MNHFIFEFLLLLSLCGLTVQGQGTEPQASSCPVALRVRPVDSNITLRGEVVKPLASTFQVQNGDIVELGLDGALYANLIGPCPKTGAELVASLLSNTGTLSTSPQSGGPLKMYPNNITLNSSLSTVEMIDIAFNISLKLPNVSGQTGNIDSILSQGYTESYSVLSPNGERVEVLGLTSSEKSPMYVTDNGTQVLLNISNFAINMEAPYQSTLAGQPISGLTLYNVTGMLVFEAMAGCSADQCGSHGRCISTENGVSVCECECGWTGSACDIQSGYCSQYNSESLYTCPMVMVPSSPAQTPVTEPYPPPTSLNSACSSDFKTYDPVSGTCICKDGWNGPGCQACVSNGACSTLYDSSATCSDARVYSVNTTFKSYTCDLEGTGLQDTIVPGTFFVSCNTTSASSTGRLDQGSFCTVNFAMQQYSDNPITCKATFCNFFANESQVNCETTSCTCERDCPQLDGVFQQIEGNPCVIDCDEKGVCTFDIKNFFIKLVAPCTNAECLVQGYSLKQGSFVVASENISDAVIAALPLIVLVLSGAGLGTFLMMHRALYFRKSSSIVSDIQEKKEPIDSHTIKDLTFQNISATLEEKNKKILTGISGSVHVGNLMGIMGPSGSGKTTLISILSASASNIKCQGRVMLDGEALTTTSAKSIGYCAQDSYLLPTLTVEESIRYSAILRLQTTSEEDILRTVTHTIDVIGLKRVASSLVGGNGRIRGISGGERKRVAVAMELVTNPSILMLDEPTSGLDSSTARSMLENLKSLALSGKIVITSIHQPSPSMFMLLDHVMLLADGQCLYDGTPEQAYKFMDDVQAPCEFGMNIAEHMLDCAANPSISDAMKCNYSSNLQSDNATFVQIEVDKDYQESKNSPTMPELITDTSDDTEHVEKPQHQGKRWFPLIRELSTLTWRTGLDMVRNPSLILLHWGMAVGMGIFVGCIFFQVGLDTSGAQNRAGGLIFALAFFAFSSLTTVDLVHHEKRVVTSEVRGGYYRPWAYYMSKLILDGIFLRFIPILLYSASFYPMMGLVSNSYNVAVYLMTLGTFAITVGALSLAVTVLSSTAGQASFLMNILLLVSLLNSGFFVNIADMPNWISWLHYLSVFFYGYSVLITNEVSKLFFNFVVSGYTAVSNVRGITFLDILGIDYTSMTTYIIVLDCMYILFILAGLVLMYLRIPRAPRLKPIP